MKRKILTAGTKKDILAPKPKAAFSGKSKDGKLNETPKKPKKVNAKFQSLLDDMKTQPKDAKGKFLDREFAKYVSKTLTEVRKSKKTK